MKHHPNDKSEVDRDPNGKRQRIALRKAKVMPTLSGGSAQLLAAIDQGLRTRVGN
jgi:hypothetical protein